MNRERHNKAPNPHQNSNNTSCDCWCKGAAYGAYFRSKLQDPKEHSGAISCSLNDDIDDAANSLFNCTGHSKPKDENNDTTCKKSTPMPSALRFTPFHRAKPRRVTSAAAKGCTHHK